MSIVPSDSSRIALQPEVPTSVFVPVTSTALVPVRSRAAENECRQEEDWSILLEARFKQVGRKSTDMDIELHRTIDAGTALKVLREVYARERLSEKTRLLGSILDHLETFNDALTSIFQGVPYNSTMLIWGCTQIFIRVSSFI